MNLFQLRLLKASLQRSSEVVPVPAEITFVQPLPMKVGDADQVLQVSSTNSVTPIELVSNDESIATVAGKVFHAVKDGLASFTATQAGGNGFLAAPPVTRTVAISAAVNPVPGGKFSYNTITDSRGPYDGDTGPYGKTSTVAFMEKRFTDAGITNIAFKNYGFPGGTAAQLQDPNYTNQLEYACDKPAGITAVDYLLSQLDPAKTNYVSIALGANPGINDLENIMAMAAKCKASSKVTKVFVELVLPRVSSDFTALNNAIKTNSVDGKAWHDGYHPVDAVPQIFASDATQNPLFFWMGDKALYSGVHLTTLGNKTKAEVDAQAFAQVIGVSLPPIVPEVVKAVWQQDNPGIIYSPANAWNSYQSGASFAKLFAGYSADASAKISFKVKCYGVQYVAPKNNQGCDVELWIDGVKVGEGTTFAASAVASAPVLQKVFGTLAVRTVEVRRKAGSTQPGMFSDEFRFADASSVFPTADPQQFLQLAADHTDGSVETVNGLIATTNGSAGDWNSGVHSLTTFPAPKGSGYVKLRVGTLSSYSGVIFGFGPAGTNTSSPKYAGIPKAIYYDRDSILGYLGGNDFGSKVQRNWSNDIWHQIYADRTEVYASISATPQDAPVPTLITTLPGVNEGELQVKVAMQGGNSVVREVTIERFD